MDVRRETIHIASPAHQAQKKFQALAKIVSSGASLFIETTIASIGETSARVYVDGDSEEPKLFQRIASGTRWSTRGRVDSGASSLGSVSKKAAEGGGATAQLRSGTGDSMKVPDELSSETKQPMADTGGAQVGPADPATSQGGVLLLVWLGGRPLCSGERLFDIIIVLCHYHYDYFWNPVHTNARCAGRLEHEPTVSVVADFD